MSCLVGKVELQIKDSLKFKCKMLKMRQIEYEKLLSLFAYYLHWKPGKKIVRMKCFLGSSSYQENTSEFIQIPW